MEALIICGYLALAAVIVFLSIKLSDYVDLLDKTTKLSGALLGGVLLAAVTSLPELFTSLSSVIMVGETDYVIGNILGSNIFDAIVLGILIVIFIKNFQEQKIAKCQLWQFGTLILMYGVTSLAVFLPDSIKKYIVLGGWFNIGSILIIGLYIFSIFKLDRTDSTSLETEERPSKLTLKQIIVRFSIAAVLLISASIGITYISDMIVDTWKIDATLAGALLLGVMTSLPEVISTFNLFLKKNVNAGCGNIIGSCVFNFTIISVSELFSFTDTVFDKNGEASKLIIFGAAAVVLLLAAVAFKLMTDKNIIHESGLKKENPQYFSKKRITLGAVEIAMAVTCFACYILYLTLPNSIFTF